MVTRPLRKTPQATETERSALLRQNSNTSVDTLEGVHNSSMQDMSGYSCTPPVILTHRDFYGIVDTTRTPLLAPDPSAERVYMGAEAQSDIAMGGEDSESDGTEATKPPENLSQLLVDFTSSAASSSIVHSTNTASNNTTGGDDVSIATYDSAGARASRPGSMTNLASFSEKSEHPD